MKIIVDGMGGDHAPREIVRGSVKAVLDYNIDITLIGDRKCLEAELQKQNAPMDRFHLISASQVITMEDSPVAAIRKKSDSSIVKGLELVRESPDRVLISAGATGALLAGGMLKVGRIRGIDRPALASILPNRKGGTLLLDMGANTECKPENLAQFAAMGTIYMERVLGRPHPTVGLLNVGTERTKGSGLYRSAYQLLEERKGIRFQGNVEAREIPGGAVDVLVCDGFTGNVILKYTEGLAFSFLEMMREEPKQAPASEPSGNSFLKSGLAGFRKRMDYTEVGGAPLLGIRGGIIKAHGSSNATAIKNAIYQGILYLKNGVLERIQDAVSDQEGKR